MSFYIRRESSKLWKRFCSEISTEITLLAENWKYFLSGVICQYIHGLAARGVHYIHRPGPILQDTGFFLLPELGQDKAYISETLFSCMFLSFVLVKSLFVCFNFLLVAAVIYVTFIGHWAQVLNITIATTKSGLSILLFSRAKKSLRF